ncbi:MAG TPA: CARDB domain-containing protein [Solirubrobacterales bacterium]
MIRSRALLIGALALLAAAVPAAALGAGEPAPNLTVTELSKPPAALTVGGKLKIVIEVRNRGRLAATKSRATLYLARGAKHTSRDVVLGHAKVRPVPAGRRATTKLIVDLPKGKLGSYRLIACADSGKRIKEAREDDNCTAARLFRLTPPPPRPRPGRPVTDSGTLAIAPAFTISDGIDWGFVRDESAAEPEPGDPVTLTLRAGNRIAGQAGYTRANVAPAPLLAGTATTLDYSESGEDDGVVTVDLPFAFPFGGIAEQRVSVSTNGWISFGAPAWDFWSLRQLTDYRGVAALVGEHDRGIMPYWTDLTLEDIGVGAGTVREVIAADGSAIAFQWNSGQLSNNGGGPRRLFQVVLFRDGSFRLDYPGVNEAGGLRSFVGFSLGTGPDSATILAEDSLEVPAGSVLFTPKPLPASSISGNLPAGEVTATLPVRSDLLEAGPGCELTLPSTAFSTGLVTCPMPTLALGRQASQTVTFSMPPNAPGELEPANFRLSGTYESAGATLGDGEEINALDGRFPPATIDVFAEFDSPVIPRPGVPAQFGVELEVPTTEAALDEPIATFELPDDVALDMIQIAGEEIPCGPVTDRTVACGLPSGTSFTAITVSVTPSVASVGSELTLGVTADALNTPPASVSVTTPPVQAP